MSSNMSSSTLTILSPGFQHFAYPNVSDILNFNCTVQEYNNLIKIANVKNLWQTIEEDSNCNECGWLNSLIRVCNTEA